MRSMRGADAVCLAVNYRSLSGEELLAKKLFRLEPELLDQRGVLRHRLREGP